MNTEFYGEIGLCKWNSNVADWIIAGNQQQSAFLSCPKFSLMQRIN